ncbi:MAG: ABC-F family ATP-binding cassette domain-containing protein [Synergistaceae bacterium]|nr:ABC-F family ATP-binding cassette domain-containing protein [Synergistaceae bacterium]
MIDIRSLRLSFGEKIIFSGIDWRIADRDRVGLVGDNGVGKTTLLRVLSKEVEPDEGLVGCSKNLTMGYLPQDLVELGDAPVLVYLKRRSGVAEVEERLRDTEQALAETHANSKNLPSLLAGHALLERRFERLGGFGFEPAARRVLHGLGFEVGDAERSCREFSGGWKMRVALAALLLIRPDVLLLDEPTNHLDTESMEWLEDWLRDYEGAMVAVSHDRRFLENMTEKTVELARSKLTLYPWGYERYLIEKEAAQGRLEKAVQEQRERVIAMERFISRFRYKASKAGQVQSRIKQLEKMEVLENDDPSKTARFRIPEAPDSGWQTLFVKNVSKSYGGRKIFAEVDFTLNRGERAALVGVNGAGKSTLLRLLSGAEEPTDGSIQLGFNVRLAFYSQESAQNVDYSRTVWEEARAAPSKLTEAGKRNLLGAFLFSGEDVHKPVSVLSGGEKARLALFKLMLKESNFLILDEPTNHLDLNTKELFQRALLQYKGTLLIVSHDRHFLDNLADRVVEIRGGRLYDYPGNYSWFLEKREALRERMEGVTGKKERAPKAEVRQTEMTRESKKEAKTLEGNIDRMERRQGEIDALLCLPETLSNSTLVRALMKERAGLEKELSQNYQRWEALWA